MFRSLYFILFFISLSYTQNIDINSTQYKKIAKVNHVLLTTEVFGKKAIFFEKLSTQKKEQLINKVINDELLAQVLLQGSSILKISNPQERIKKAIMVIDLNLTKEINGSITQNEIAKYYSENQQALGIEDFSIASHILVKDKKEAKKIIKILQEASDLNSTFKVMVKKYSIDSKTIKSEGYLGLFPDRIMVEPFRRSLKTLKEGNFTEEPVKTRFGYHIIWLHKKLDKSYFSLDRLSPYIRKRLLSEKKTKWLSEKLEEFKKEAKIIKY